MVKRMPLGSKREYPYKKTDVRLNPNDVVLIMTYVFPELFNQQREMLGYLRVESLFLEAVDRYPQEIITHLNGMSSIWLDGQEQSDILPFLCSKEKHLQSVKSYWNLKNM